MEIETVVDEIIGTFRLCDQWAIAQDLHERVAYEVAWKEYRRQELEEWEAL